jgi:EpsI family protein
MALSVAIPILANGFRAFIVVLIGYLSNNAAAASADHILYGWVIFAVVLLAMVAIAVVMREPEDAHEAALSDTDRRSRAGSPSAVLSAALCSLLIIASFQASAAAVTVPPTHSATRSRLPISVQVPWTAIAAKDSSPPMFQGADRVWTQTYSDGSARIYLRVAYFNFERPGVEVASSQQQFGGASPGIPIAETNENLRVAGEEIRAGELTFTKANRRRVLLHWFWVDDRFTGNPYAAKLLQLKARLLGGNNAAAIVVISTDVMGDESSARRALGRFAEAFRWTPKPGL